MDEAAAAEVPDGEVVEGVEGELAEDEVDEEEPLDEPADDEPIDALGGFGFEETRELGEADEDEAQPGRVSLKGLMKFIFPPGLQHPMSTGRLYAFGFYGPLDADAQLRSGHKGQHVVSRWELDTMCMQFEREDILQVYVSPEHPLCTLSEAQQEELVQQADARMKAQQGRGLMPQLPKKEVLGLFSDLARAEDGSLTFHEMQKRIIDFRNDRIERLKVIFPGLTSKTAGGVAGGRKERSGGGGAPAGGGVRIADGPPAVRWQTAGPKGPTAAARTRGRVSSECAPPEMFSKDKGFTNNGVASHTNRLLSTKAFKLCNIVDGNSSELTANVRLIRDDRPDKQLGKTWDANCCKRKTHRGGFVKTYRSGTTGTHTLRVHPVPPRLVN
jgi:hypothetical protein